MTIFGFRFFVKRYIGGASDPLMIRWVLVGFPWGGGIYIHKFVRSDHDRALHDHPWNFVAIVLKGGYWERYVPLRAPSAHKCFEKRAWRGPGSILRRPAIWKHRVELLDRCDYIDPSWREEKIPSWSLVFVGRRRQPWGFWVPDYAGNTTWCWWRKYNSEKAICEDEIIHHGGED